MHKILLAALLALLPLAGSAQDTSNSDASNYSLRNMVLISAGAVAGMVLVDFLIGEALTVPNATVITPAVREAGAAGAVFGDQVAAATVARNAKARVDVIYALVIGGGAVLGGWALNQLKSKISSSYSK